MDSNKSEDKKTSFPSYRQGRFERAIFPFLKFEKYYGAGIIKKLYIIGIIAIIIMTISSLKHLSTIDVIISFFAAFATLRILSETIILLFKLFIKSEVSFNKYYTSTIIKIIFFVLIIWAIKFYIFDSSITLIGMIFLMLSILLLRVFCELLILSFSDLKKKVDK